MSEKDRNFLIVCALSALALYLLWPKLREVVTSAVSYGEPVEEDWYDPETGTWRGYVYGLLD